ncbi:hypothetical protein JST97_06300 [bacterium]|nr:hypothetical protein [bacterium]
MSMEERLNVADQILIDVSEQLLAQCDSQPLLQWLGVLDGLQEAATKPEIKAHRALLAEFSSRILKAPEASLTRLEELLGGGLAEVAMLMSLCLGLEPGAVSAISPMFRVYQPLQQEVQSEMRRLWEMPGEARMQLERAWVLKFLGP